MSQVGRNLAFSIEIAVFISVDVVEAVVLGEGGIWDNRRSVAFPVSELFDGAVVRGLYIGIIVHLYTPSPPSLVLVL